MKSLINEYVEHTKFGRGFIVQEDADKITVEFVKQTGNKMFQLPDAFEHFLRFEDISLQEECLLLLKSKKQLITEEMERKRLVQKKMDEERIREELEKKKKYKKTAKVKDSKGVRKIVKKESESDNIEE